VFELAVIGLDRIVRMPLDVMPRRRNQLVEDRGVDRGGVGNHLGRRHLQYRQGLLEEPEGTVGVAAGGHKYVDGLPFWSMARYTYRQIPLTFTYVSSTNHLSPGARRANRAASARSGVNRCTHR
jgi:hypothetical protein